MDGIMSDEKKKIWSRRDELINAADGITLKADILAHEGKYVEAVKCYDRALAINPKNPDLWVFKGITLSGGLGKDNEARQCWDQAKKLDPDLEEAIEIRKEPNTDEEVVKPEDLTCGMTVDRRARIRRKMKNQLDEIEGKK